MATPRKRAKRSILGEAGTEDRTVQYGGIRPPEPAHEEGNEDETVQGSTLDMDAIRSQLAPISRLDISQSGNEDPTLEAFLPDLDELDEPPEPTLDVDLEPLSISEQLPIYVDEERDPAAASGFALDEIDEMLGFEFDEDDEDGDEDTLPGADAWELSDFPGARDKSEE